MEISQPSNKYNGHYYSVRPLFDKIKTLEDVPASLPYGGSSGSWGILVRVGQNSMEHL
ncbi:hypothetical protein [Chryseobacterium indoltheticum]|uniref:hypothetical protein n=1 Tax=Chryseobacterium indoltheticum TaxID=254 RepID=UPI003F491E2E